MALTDELTAIVLARIKAAIIRTESSISSFSGLDMPDHDILFALADGSGIRQATGWFAAEFEAPFLAQATLSLASMDPLGSLGDAAPSESPEGKKLRLLLLQNLEDPSESQSTPAGIEWRCQFGTAIDSPAANPLSNLFVGSQDAAYIPPGGFFFWADPSGVHSTNMSDGVDDELLIRSNAAAATMRLTYLFG